MLSLQPALIHMDEAGHVYLPTLGPGGTCLRLNAAGSRLWRRVVAGALDELALGDGERDFIADLVDKGALRHAPRTARETR